MTGKRLTMPSVAKTRFSLKRRPSETLIRKSLENLTASRKSLGPSVNPVRKSVADPSSNKIQADRDFIVHYHRKLHSHLTIDSRHEEYYARHGYPAKPKYQREWRRFSGSSDTDPDYKAYDFRVLAELLNGRHSFAQMAGTNTANLSSSTNSSKSDKSTNSQRSTASSYRGEQGTLSEIIMGKSRGKDKEKPEVVMRGYGQRKSVLSKYEPSYLRKNEKPPSAKPPCFKLFLLLLRKYLCCVKSGEVNPEGGFSRGGDELSETTSDTNEESAKRASSARHAAKHKESTKGKKKSRQMSTTTASRTVLANKKKK